MKRRDYLKYIKKDDIEGLIKNLEEKKIINFLKKTKLSFNSFLTKWLINCFF